MKDAPAELSIRVMQEADFEFADSLRRMVGFNQTVADWRRLLSLEPEACFVGRCQGRDVATTTVTCFGRELAWIGMVLVHPEFRRRGFAGRLLRHALELLDRRAIRCVKLDATPRGQLVYERLGFTPAWSLARWEGNHAAAADQASRPHVRPLITADWRAIVSLDRRAFGASREHLLRSLAIGSTSVLIATSPRGVPTGYGMLRAGATADYLGPVVAASPVEGRELVNALLAGARRRTLFWDVPEGNLPATELAAQLGFRRQRPFVRMARGRPASDDRPIEQFAIADPATG